MPGAFHSAEWNHDVDLTDKRVVVIGAGASAVQFVPHVAEAAAHLPVLQRTPNWFVPVDDVSLDGAPIDRIESDAVVTRDVDGNETRHVADVIIYATGFTASKFLTPMTVTGSGGRDLHEEWGDDARAYLGIVHPGFPNFFLTYGPNTNIVVNGSIIYFSECEVHDALGMIEMLLRNEWSSADCRHEVHDEYGERIDAGNLKMAWGVSTVNSWHKAASGRVAQNWPFSLLEYWQQTRTPDPADYITHPA